MTSTYTSVMGTEAIFSPASNIVECTNLKERAASLNVVGRCLIHLGRINVLLHRLSRRFFSYWHLLLPDSLLVWCLLPLLGELPRW